MSQPKQTKEAFVYLGVMKSVWGRKCTCCKKRIAYNKHYWYEPKQQVGVPHEKLARFCLDCLPIPESWQKVTGIQK